MRWKKGVKPYLRDTVQCISQMKRFHMVNNDYWVVNYNDEENTVVISTMMGVIRSYTVSIFGAIRNPFVATTASTKQDITQLHIRLK